MKKQYKTTEATQQAFVDAFCELCKTMPFEKITVQALTKRAGYNRCTFYNYFNDIFDVLELIEQKMLLLIKKNIFEDKKDINNIEEFISSFENIIKGQEKYIEVLVLIIHNSSFTEKLKSFMIPAFMKEYNISNKDIKSIYVLEYHLSGIIAIMTSWVIKGKNIPVRQLGDIIRGVVSEGVHKMLAKNAKKPTAYIEKQIKCDRQDLI